MIFQEIFKKYRKEFKLTQVEIAREFGVSDSLVSQWERGQCTPDPEMLEAIADFFGISINELLGSYAPNQLKDLNMFKGFPLDRFAALTTTEREVIGHYVETMIDMLNKDKSK